MGGAGGHRVSEGWTRSWVMVYAAARRRRGFEGVVVRR